MVEYSNIVQYYHYLNITKLEMLSDYTNTTVAVRYKVDRRMLEPFSADLEKLNRVEVIYDYFR